jgi:DNA-binding PadR family transcriptional regulator
VKRPASELESFVIGLVWQSGPCSAYDVRRALTASPSTQWSASAGAIYPLVRRLEKRGLLQSRTKTRGKRARRLYSVTPAGRRALRHWIGPPIAEEAITVTYDPLRSRARFLKALSKSERIRWVEASLTALEAVESRVQRWHEMYGQEPYAALLTRNGELELQVRRTWLREVRRTVERAP